MRRILWLGLATLCATSIYAADADAKSAVKSAAKKLADKSSYTWNTSSKNESGEQRFQMTIEGKTEKSGFTFLTTTFGQNEIEAVKKGDKVAVKRDGEWKTPDEMDDQQARMPRRYSTMKLPAGEAEEMADKVKELKAGDEGLCSGDLTEDAVKGLLTRFGRGGQQAPEVAGAKGWIKFWAKDGVLTKYQYNVQGTMTVGQDRREVEVNRTTTIEIKEIGTTKVTVPDEAKKKLS
jgi:hypothetical protein